MISYCKAYKNSELRKFYSSHSQPVPLHLEREDISFLWDDFIVRKSPIQCEEVIFEDITEEWKDFCQNQLSFAVPEQTSFQKLPVANSQYSPACDTFIPFTNGQRWLVEELIFSGAYFSNEP